LLALNVSRWTECIERVISGLLVARRAYSPRDNIEEIIKVYVAVVTQEVELSFHGQKVVSDSIRLLVTSVCKLYGRYNVIVFNYKVLLAHILNDLFHALCLTIVSILVLTTCNPLHLMST
jgi:hypothetical protein